jgi:hypothetical protein
VVRASVSGTTIVPLINLIDVLPPVVAGGLFLLHFKSVLCGNREVIKNLSEIWIENAL